MSALLSGDFNPDETSPLHKRMIDLTRKVARAEKKLNQFIEKKNKDMDSRLEARLEDVMAITNVENLRLMRDAVIRDSWTQYSFEIDEKIDQQNYLKGLKQHTTQRIKDNLPAWMKSVDEAINIARSTGHSKKLQWRSRVNNILRQSIIESEEDPDSEDSRNLLHKYVLGINLVNANELTRMLEKLMREYIDTSNDKGSIIGKENKLLDIVKVDLARVSSEDSVVPFTRSEWSSQLQSADLTRKQLALESTATISTLAGAQSLVSSTCTRPHNQVAAGGPLDHAFDRGILADIMEPVTANRAIAQLRKAAAEGDLKSAYRVFKKCYEPPTTKKVILTPGKILVTSLNPFKILMLAFKNSLDNRFESGYKVMNLIESYGFAPDAMIYNIMMRKCVAESRWRRVIGLFKEMRARHAVTPNALTFEIIIDACRYAVDEPAVIYETLRLIDLHPEFCYKASVCNAVHRKSKQVLSQLFFDRTVAQTADTGGSVGSHDSRDSEQAWPAMGGLDAHSSITFQHSMGDQGSKNNTADRLPAIPAK